jgi:hypothetical protein
MAHWQQDHKDEARQWYDWAVDWMNANQPDHDNSAAFVPKRASF